MLRLLLILLVAASLAGCTKAQAKTPAPPPALTTPDPPDRVIVPASIPEPEPVPVSAPPPAPAAPARPRETPARPSTPPPAPTPAAPVVDPPASPPILTTSNPTEVEQRALALIGTAERDLERINSAQLTSNARAQYDTAKGFISQAKDALKMKNVVLARELADKAAALASQLRR